MNMSISLDSENAKLDKIYLKSIDSLRKQSVDLKYEHKNYKNIPEYIKISY